MGGNVFGRTDTERVQITHKHLHNDGVYQFGGLTNFAELYLDFGHENVSNYRRSLNLNDAIAHVRYQHEGVNFTRETFMSYPDNVLVIRLTADQAGALSFTVRPEIAYLNDKESDGRTGTVMAKGDLITLKGQMPFFNINFEGQVKVLNEGGNVTAVNTADRGQIQVANATTATIIMAAWTNYELKESVFLNPPEKKLDPKKFPHETVNRMMSDAVAKGFDGLKRSHLEDYHRLFNRVSLDLGTEVSDQPTRLLVDAYAHGEKDPYLEELMFHFARYLLIASSREDSLPANLQGTWNQYLYAPWSGGYWHNINVQMNYWGAMNTDLAETFEAYINYYKAYRPQAEKHATEYVKEFSPERLSNEPGGNGWIIGSGANPYYIPPGGRIHSGPGTGGLIAKLLMDYYRFTQDKDYLREVGYPALLGLSRFYSKALQEQADGTLLVYPSASPEIRVENEVQRAFIRQFPWGRETERGYYITKGCTFDQAAVWESYKDALEGAEILGIENEPFLDTMRQEIKKLDPILIGDSGQIKEFREETIYGSIGEADHRHISHLCPLYPGTLIGSANPEWQKAAAKTLDLRGNDTRNWAMAHRMNARARLGQAEEAHEVYQKFIAERTFPNLLTWQPPFQVDGTFGSLAGVAEMLLQSHEGMIKPIPALPKAWRSGSFNGLVARGNFKVSAAWKDGILTKLTIESRSGGPCRVKVPEGVSVVDQHEKPIAFESGAAGVIAFPTEKGGIYSIQKL
jgi:alpha-L-fucosidase 2